jgi:hypothetical protein
VSINASPSHGLARKEGFLWNSCILSGRGVHSRARWNQGEGIWLRVWMDGHNLCLQLNERASVGMSTCNRFMFNSNENVPDRFEPPQRTSSYGSSPNTCWYHVVSILQPSTWEKQTMGGILQAVTNRSIFIFIFLSLISFRSQYGQLLAPGCLPNPAACISSHSFSRRHIDEPNYPRVFRQNIFPLSGGPRSRLVSCDHARTLSRDFTQRAPARPPQTTSIRSADMPVPHRW